MKYRNGSSLAFGILAAVLFGLALLTYVFTTPGQAGANIGGGVLIILALFAVGLSIVGRLTARYLGLVFAFWIVGVILLGLVMPVVNPFLISLGLPRSILDESSLIYTIGVVVVLALRERNRIRRY